MSASLVAAVWVPGHPKTKGSLNFYGKNQVREEVDNSAWREAVRGAVERDIERRGTGPATDGPMAVEVTFWLDHPNVHGPNSQAGDLDKLIRLVLDALKDAGAYLDDNQVACLPAPMKFKSNGRPGDSGASIIVNRMTPEELARMEAPERRFREAIQRGVINL